MCEGLDCPFTSSAFLSSLQEHSCTVKALSPALRLNAIMILVVCAASAFCYVIENVDATTVSSRLNLLSVTIRRKHSHTIAVDTSARYHTYQPKMSLHTV